MKNIVVAVLSVLILTTACNSEKSKLKQEIAELEKKIVTDSSNFTFDKKVQIELGEKLAAYAEKFPEDAEADKYMYKAASIYIGMGNGTKAIETLQKYLKMFVGKKDYQQALFNIGYVYDTQLHDKEKAMAAYKAFLRDFPKHPLAKDTQTMIELLDKNISDEDLVKSFLAKEKADSTAKKITQ